ncbi:MAG: hypothetical protein ACK4SZ_15670 [Allosphingosinicella sp.]|uniref:hypothetical protein n=1 Tax=Allosphingosinicella sp. TaxID=2823234 RepID=UPI00392EE217
MRELLRRYLTGTVPLGRLFFVDMLLTGTMVNLAAGVAALVAFGLDLPAWAAIAIFLSPLPFNLLLSVSVWRSAARQPSRWSDIARIGAAAWFFLMLIV